MDESENSNSGLSGGTIALIIFIIIIFLIIIGFAIWWFWYRTSSPGQSGPSGLPGPPGQSGPSGSPDPDLTMVRYGDTVRIFSISSRQYLSPCGGYRSCRTVVSLRTDDSYKNSAGGDLNKSRDWLINTTIGIPNGVPIKYGDRVTLTSLSKADDDTEGNPLAICTSSPYNPLAVVNNGKYQSGSQYWTIYKDIDNNDDSGIVHYDKGINFLSYDGQSYLRSDSINYPVDESGIGCGPVVDTYAGNISNVFSFKKKS